MALDVKPQAEKAEKTSRDIAISGIAGLFTGGVFGFPLSIGSYLLWRKIGLKGAARWWVWAATGIIGVPISWGVFAVVVNPDKTATVAPSSPIVNNAPAKKESPVNSSQDAISVGEFKTDSFVYTNVRMTPYTVKNEFVQKQSRVAGALYEITADVQNIGNESKAPALTSIEVSDSQGRKYKEADGVIRFGDTTEKGQKATDYVLPGQSSQSVRLSLVDVSPDASDFTLTIRSGFFDKTIVKPIQ